jgi:hypothetical protein
MLYNRLFIGKIFNIMNNTLLQRIWTVITTVLQLPEQRQQTPAYIYIYSNTRRGQRFL